MAILFQYAFYIFVFYDSTSHSTVVYCPALNAVVCMSPL